MPRKLWKNIPEDLENSGDPRVRELLRIQFAMVAPKYDCTIWTVLVLCLLEKMTESEVIDDWISESEAELQKMLEMRDNEKFRNPFLR